MKQLVTQELEPKSLDTEKTVRETTMTETTSVRTRRETEENLLPDLISNKLNR